MTKKVVLMTILLGLLFLPLSNQTSILVYVSETNIFEGLFTEPYETLYIFCEDGARYSFTTHDEGMVKITAFWLCEFLNSKGHEISNITQIIHNHFGYPFMSQTNIRFMNFLRNLGFRGVFSMIDMASGKMVHIRNDDG